MRCKKLFAGFHFIAWLGVVAVSSMAVAEPFPDCIKRLQGEAEQRGVSASLIEQLGMLKPLERTIKLDRSQPEFVQTFAGYFNQRVTGYRIQNGRKMLAEHRDYLDKLTEKYGVPAQYLVSFWAMESNFGRHIGKMSVLDTLATLACDDRRSTFFTGELFSALELMEANQFTADKMEGSWAGAIGQTQFLPSAYVQYGRDGDGDGKVDLWRSRDDALTSAAYYLQQLGWQPELRWGREVYLPKGFPYHLAGLDDPKTLQQWKQLGVLRADKTPLSDAEINAALLVPEGVEGPKFLVYDNFHVIMKWNRSQYYALAVGHLADRINGSGSLQQPLPARQPLTKDQIIQLQTKLETKGFYAGDLDGQVGPQTRAAIRGFQKSVDLVADGFADLELLKAVD